jgi:hypothetical protein
LSKVQSESVRRRNLETKLTEAAFKSYADAIRNAAEADGKRTREDVEAYVAAVKVQYDQKFRDSFSGFWGERDNVRGVLNNTLTAGDVKAAVRLADAQNAELFRCGAWSKISEIESHCLDA